MKKWMTFILLLFSFFFLLSDQADAAAQLQCQYQGVFTNFCGDGAGDDCKVDFVIKLENNKFSLVSAKWTNTFADIDGCRQGDSVDKCLISAESDTIKFNYIYAIKSDGNGKYVKMTDEDYTNFFVKGDYYSCPSSVTVLSHESESLNTTFGMYVTDIKFEKKYCPGNEIDDFSCQVSSTFNLTKEISRTKYTGGTITSTPSSGNCCVYKDKTVNIYTYLLNTNGVTSYAACLGDSSCITSSPNTSSNAQFITGTEWKNYHNIVNCNNMPQEIYYTNADGKVVFSTNVKRGYNMATLDVTTSCVSNVYSSDGINSEDGKNNNTNSTPTNNSNSYKGDELENGCPKILLPAFKLIRKIIDPIIQIGIPILLIVMGTIDFGKAVSSSDDKNIKEAGNKFLKRCIAAVAVFFVVTIVNLLMGMFSKTSYGKQADWQKCWEAAKD
jgi:hypothetical protein